MAASKSTPAPAKNNGPTKKQREVLARKIIKMREAKTPWDGDNGICAQLGLKGAPAGRKLMREFGAGEQIAESYNRDEAKAKREAVAK